MIHFKLFYHLVSRSNFDPQTISFCRLGSWKKYILGIDQRKDNHPGSFHCKAFVLLHKFERLYSGLSVFPLVSYHPTFGFFQFFSNFSDKPVARSLQAYALTYLTDFFCLRGFIFHDNHKKQGRSSSNSGYKIQNISPRKIYSRTCTFGVKVHISNIRVKRWHKKYETLNKIERRNFCLKYLFIKSNRTALQTYNCT